MLLELAAYLKKMARYGDGSASETLRDYPQPRSPMLSFKSRDSDAEMHEGCAFLFFILAGSATLLMGGTLMHPRKVESGEMQRRDRGQHTPGEAGRNCSCAAGVHTRFWWRGENRSRALW